MLRSKHNVELTGLYLMSRGGYLKSGPMFAVTWRLYIHAKQFQ